MTQTTALTLDAVKQQFDDWRAHKQHSDQIPERLWDLVRELIDKHHYKRTPVGRALGISSGQLKRQLGPALHDNPPKTQPNTKPQFVQTSLSTLMNPTTPTSPPAIKIEKPDGMTLSLTHLSDAQFSQLLNHFIG